MRRHYQGLTDRMLSEINTISDSMSHAGERGRNNELVLGQFLERNLARRYTVSTGKVISANGQESGQVDLIIHDRLNAPELIEGRAWRLIPVETVYAVISVKTTLNRRELGDALDSVASVRGLPRTAALEGEGKRDVPIPEDRVLRPRGFVFAFRSAWQSPESSDSVFCELLSEKDDALRPNGVCILDQCFSVRKPYTTSTQLYPQHSLMHFFVYLSQSIDSFPRYRLDLRKYFREDYGQY